MIIDVADYMLPLAHFTHITAYLWLVKHAPAVWARIDRYQKRQSTTSPEWFYRHCCRKLFDLAQRVSPRALVATEVGCCEIAALIKRDLSLPAPLLAVSNEPDVERAWVRPEVDLYCFSAEECAAELIRNGAPANRIRIWGAPLASGFETQRDRQQERAAICQWLGLDPQQPLVLIAGGSEGMARVEESAACLLQMHKSAPQLVVLAGRNQRLANRCQRLAQNESRKRLRVLGWTAAEQIASLMAAADLMVSKLGSMFNEAIASMLPIVALEPPPGSERLQYRLLGEWQVGCPVRTMPELTKTVENLLVNPQKLAAMRERARARRKLDATQRIARWLVAASNGSSSRQTLREDTHQDQYDN